MVEVSTARAWDCEVQRGPNLLFVKPHGLGTNYGDTPELAERVWALLEQHFTVRLVLELDALEHLDSHLVGQLIMLQKRVATQGGIMRICGLSARNEEVLRLCRLDNRMPLYRNREDAIMSVARPLQPR